MTWLLLALAGGAGAVCRFLQDARVGAHNRLRFPVGTITVNTLACFLLGLLVGAASALGAPHTVVTVLGTGFLGGYSTFSTASVEGARLLLTENRFDAVVHTLGMAALGLLAAMLGLFLGSLL